MTQPLDKLDQLDLFVADIIDIAPKGDLHSMEYPIFAVSSKPDIEKFRYENANGNWLEIIPSVNGRATIHDKDMLLYCFADFGTMIGQGIDADLAVLQAWFARVGARPAIAQSFHASEIAAAEA